MVQVGLSIVDRSPQASLEIHFNSEQDGASDKWYKSASQLWTEVLKLH